MSDAPGRGRPPGRAATTATNGGMPTPEEQRSVNMLGLLTLGLRRLRLLVGFPLAVGVAALVISLVVAKRYAAESRFMPETESQMPSEMAGLAAEFGLTPPTSQGESLAFYAELLRSNELLRAVVRTQYEFPIRQGADTLRGDLLSLYRIDGDSPAERLQNGVLRLRENDIAVIPKPTANLVGLRTLAPWPALAEALNLRMLALVNRFNLERRQSRALEERRFLEGRVEQAERDLRGAEDSLEAFVASNRRYSGAPDTRLEYDRLQRRVSFLQQIRSSRAQALEQARVEAVRNTPVITVVDGPQGTALKVSPKPLVNALLGVLAGLALAVCFLMASEMLARARRERPEEYRELTMATRDTLGRLAPASVLRRLRRGSPGRVPAGTVADNGDGEELR